MSLVLELRDHTRHGQNITLVHTGSEDVLTGTVFGILRNFRPETFLLPWLAATCHRDFSAGKWLYSFWEEQPLPTVPKEGHSHIDLVISSPTDLIFVEAKLSAMASQRTKYDPDRDQLTRNLDVGYARSVRERRQFELIYLTADAEEPPEVGALRASPKPYHANKGIDPQRITCCLRWSSWAAIGYVMAQSYLARHLNDTEELFARDVLAYLAKKALWRNTLNDEAAFYDDKLWRPLQRNDSPFVPFKSQRRDLDNGWRRVQWDSADELKTLLRGLPMSCKALLKLMAESGGSILQQEIMSKLLFLRDDSAVLRRVKSQINGICKQAGRMPILAEGYGDSGPRRVHDFNPDLGPLRQVVILEVANFEIEWKLLNE